MSPRDLIQNWSS